MKKTFYYLVLATALSLVGLVTNASEARATPVDTSQAQETESTFLPVEEAYALSIRVENQQPIINWHIAEGYYLYRDRIHVRQINGDQLDELATNLPEGKLKQDPNIGDTHVFYHGLSVRPALNSTAPITLKISFQGCADAGLCYPPHHQWFDINPASGSVVEINKPVANTPNTALKPSASTPINNISLLTLLTMAGMAFAGGLILNLMPCVFPVLALKGLSLVESTDISPRQRRLHGLVYTAGVVSSFVAVAGLLMILRATGQQLGWGYQLQSPWFVAAMVYLFFVVGLSFSGMIELGARFAGAGQALTEKSGMSGSFFTGVLAVLVASPCTAPFMGASLGFALTQPMIVALTVFVALGLGMATPFLLLSWSPHIARLLPRPGKWMVTMKEVLAFPMYLTAIWLLWVLGRQSGVDAVMLVLIGCLLIVIALYFWSRTPWQRGISVVATLFAAFILASSSLDAKPLISATNEEIIAYRPGILTELQRDAQPIFLNVTADWCITCLANERVALSSDKIKDRFKDLGLRYVKADWTNQDDDITQLLAAYERSGVPLYVYFPGGNQEPIVLPQLLSVDALLAIFTKSS
ncbi:protein-disulfide reductase DsbD family protein [Zhongshania sp. BJYM1]|uniref:protein-disulfide reductase DsbD family protein n=1 Tax=Zhongshania aquatica TaxID=2965069 RepID=UPI0022B30435|nr:protein-disulfide reductase DsbD [Marortus sp. BJYM1]